MESGNGGTSSKGVLVPVPDTCEEFQSSILAPLQSSHLYEESKQFFRFHSAVLVKNPSLEEKYEAFRAKRRQAGYSEEDLKESYGFLFFDDVNKANALGETGVLTGNSSCTTLGDPSKGVCISMYSDCLDVNRWYHGKSGYIAIIKLTKGKVRNVLENYTQSFTAPSVGFDCHVSEQLPSVSSNTSSFLAFERTQYYMYELLDDGSNLTAKSPSAACPFAVVSFSYTDNKATSTVAQDKSEVKTLACPYLPWRGKLQIGSQFYSLGLRSTAGAFIPAKLPLLVKVDRAISMLDLRQLLPKAVFETSFTGEAFLDGLYCSRCELVSTEVEESCPLTLLLEQIKEKDTALPFPLNDGGILILLHSSNFLTYDDVGSGATEVLQAIFIFSHSRVPLKETKSELGNPSISTEFLPILPALNYAEGEVGKSAMDPKEELSDVVAQHMLSYAALVNPGLQSSASRELGMFPDQYDVPDADQHLYSTPEWNNKAWQSLRSYMNKPAAFQLPLSKASEILAAGQEERGADLDDDVYICLSSPEADSPVSMRADIQVSDQNGFVNVETSLNSGSSTAEEVDLPTVPQSVVLEDLQEGYATKEDGQCVFRSELQKTDEMVAKKLLTPPVSSDLPTELIVSFTSAEKSVSDDSQSIVSNVSTIKLNDFEFSGFTTKAQLQDAQVTSPSEETGKSTKLSGRPKIAKKRKLQKSFTKQQKVSAARVDTTRKLLLSQRKLQKFSIKNKKLRSTAVDLVIAEEKALDLRQKSLGYTISVELEACPFRKKIECWDLKPIVSECGRILVPHGSVDFADQIKSLKRHNKSREEDSCPEKTMLDLSTTAHETEKVEQVGSALETIFDGMEIPKSVDVPEHPGNVFSNYTNPEQNNKDVSDDCNCSVPLTAKEKGPLSQNKAKDFHPPPAHEEKHKDIVSPENGLRKGEFLFSKLKSVILKGKRKALFSVTKETTENPDQNIQLLKKGKVDSDMEALKDPNLTEPSDNVGVMEAAGIIPVDVFAYALGLTPKGAPNDVQNTDNQDVSYKETSTERRADTSSDKQYRIIQRPPSIFPRRTRMKTLKKHQSMSAECIKKKWWLHFQTPACYASETLVYKDCDSDSSVRNTVQEKENSPCSSTDALNLLADLALNGNSDQFPPQTSKTLERAPETSFNKCDLTKNLSSTVQESILHVLLRQPAARASVESPSRSNHVDNKELVHLLFLEHAYSLPQSSFPLLGPPGTPSSRLLLHHQTLNGNGIKTLNPSVGREDRIELDRTPQYLKKYMAPRLKFRYSRTFVDMGATFQVTRQWQENYDFYLDTKFPSDAKNKAVIRALHGPWDFSTHDTSEEMQLVVHMWIGLFYSRSTARFFQIDSKVTYPFSEESDSLELESGFVSGPTQSELESGSFTKTADTSTPEALDLRKKNTSASDCDSAILDLSLRNRNAEIITSNSLLNEMEASMSSEQKDACETLDERKPPTEQHKGDRQIWLPTMNISEVNDVKSIHDSEESYTPHQHALSMKNADVSSFQGHSTVTAPQDDIKIVSDHTEMPPILSGIDQMLHECKETGSEMQEKSLQQHETDRTKPLGDEKNDTCKKAEGVVIEDEPDKLRCKDEESCQMNAPMVKQSKEISDFDFDRSRRDYEQQEAKSNEGAGLSSNCSPQVLIPFIGIDISGDYATPPHGSVFHDNVKTVVQGQEEIPFISDSTNHEADDPIEVHGGLQICSKKEETSSPKLSLHDAGETYQPVDWRSESDNRCPTPTIDEKPYEHTSSSPYRSTAALGVRKSRRNATATYLVRGSACANGELPMEQKLGHASTINTVPGTHHLQSDLEERTLRVLQSINNSLSKSNQTDKSNQIPSFDVKESLDASFKSRKKYNAPAALKEKITGKDKLLTGSHDLQRDSTDTFSFSSLKNKVEQVLGVGLQSNRRDLSGPQHYLGKSKDQKTPKDDGVYRSVPSTERSEMTGPHEDQEIDQTPQSNSSHEPHSFCQRPIMAVKPSSQVFSEDLHREKSFKNEHSITPVVTYMAQTAMILEKMVTDPLKGNSKGLKGKYKAIERSSKSVWQPNVSHHISNSDASGEVYPENSDEAHGYMNWRSALDIKHKKMRPEIDQTKCPATSTPFVAHRDNGMMDGTICHGPMTTVTCTIYNTSGKKESPFLEQISKRCLKDDLTRASVEQEYLIFSEQMKEMVKKNKRKPTCQRDTNDKLRSFCTSPMTVNFSSLEEHNDSLKSKDISLVGQKFKVDLSDRKNLACSKEDKKTLNTQELSQGAGNPVEPVWISSVTAECARQYKEAMHDICGVEKVANRQKAAREDRSCTKARSSNHFDFCDQMKKEMDDVFLSNLNSIVKKSCKTKYRFFLLVTSADGFFDETKALLEAEGHTAVKPSEFFREDSLSTLLIILRNEDIAEHICQVPHLLDLKRSSNVQFAGIDKPDDVVTLTHQELFIRGGFVMIDKAALEALTICSMRKVSETLQEMNRMGKWKWMLHYRDSRRLKENARLSAEAEEKKNFLNRGQDAGILEVLPYHECDLMSRDQPDYLTCLVRLQIQNISARNIIFLTDTKTNGAYERNGILTMTINAFLTKSTSESFSV